MYFRSKNLMIRRVVFFIPFLILLAGCGQVIMYTVWGIKSPKPETINSILSYEKKVGYSTTKNNFFIDSSKIDAVWKGAFPKAFIYNKRGETLLFLDCFATGIEQLTTFFENGDNHHKPVSDTLRIIMGQDTIKHVAPDFRNTMASIRPLNEFSESVSEKADYYIVYFWSKAFGRINKKIGAKMEQYIHRHPEFNAAFIKINCDYQKDWGYSKKTLKTKWK